MSLKKQVEVIESVKATTPASSATSVITLVAGTDFPTTANRVRILGYGVHCGNAAGNAGDVAFVVNGTQVAPSAFLGVGTVNKLLPLPALGVPISPGGNNIVITYTHAATVTLQSWVVFRVE